MAVILRSPVYMWSANHYYLRRLWQDSSYKYRGTAVIILGNIIIIITVCPGQCHHLQDNAPHCWAISCSGHIRLLTIIIIIFITVRRTTYQKTVHYYHDQFVRPNEQVVCDHRQRQRRQTGNYLTLAGTYLTIFFRHILQNVDESV